MSRLTAIPEKGPIYSADPYSLLGRKRGGEGYDVGTPIQKSGDGNGDSINMWSRKKPMVPKVDHPWPLTEAERAAVNYGINLYYGDTQLTYPSDSGPGLKGVPSITKVVAPVELPKYLWKYDRRPGAGNWKRSTDWAGYCAHAAPPVSPAGDPILYNSDMKLVINGAATSIMAEDNLRLIDFQYLADYYFCVLVYNPTTMAPIGYATASTSIGEGGYEVAILRSQLIVPSIKKFGYILCATQDCKPDFSAQDGVGNFLPLPCEKALVGTITINTGSEFNILAYAVGERNSVSGYLISDFLPSIGDNKYWGIQSGVWLFSELWSTSGNSVNLPISNVMCRVTQNLGTTAPVSRKIPPAAMYLQNYKGGSFTSVKTVSIPANGDRVYVIFDISTIVSTDEDGIASLPIKTHGSLMATIGRVVSADSDFAGAGVINFNIWDGPGITTATGGLRPDEPYDPGTLID